MNPSACPIPIVSVLIQITLYKSSNAEREVIKLLITVFGLDCVGMYNSYCGPVLPLGWLC